MHSVITTARSNLANPKCYIKTIGWVILLIYVLYISIPVGKNDISHHDKYSQRINTFPAIKAYGSGKHSRHLLIMYQSFDIHIIIAIASQCIVYNHQEDYQYTVHIDHDKNDKQRSLIFIHNHVIVVGKSCLQLFVWYCTNNRYLNALLAQVLFSSRYYCGRLSRSRCKFSKKFSNDPLVQAKSRSGQKKLKRPSSQKKISNVLQVKKISNVLLVKKKTQTSFR